MAKTDSIRSEATKPLPVLQSGWVALPSLPTPLLQSAPAGHCMRVGPCQVQLRTARYHLTFPSRSRSSVPPSQSHTVSLVWHWELLSCSHLLPTSSASSLMSENSFNSNNCSLQCQELSGSDAMVKSESFVSSVIMLNYFFLV